MGSLGINFTNLVVDLNFTPEQDEQLRIFTDEVMKKRGKVRGERYPGEPPKDKFWWDQFFGTKCEFASEKVLTGWGFACSPPDISIHDRGSYKRDLVATKDGITNKIHVKSAHRYGDSISWVCQTDDPLLYSPNDNDFILCVEIINENKYAILALVKATEVLNLNLWKPTKKYFPLKRALYFSDLLKNEVSA